MIVSWQTLLLTIPAGIVFLACCSFIGTVLFRLVNYNKRASHVFSSGFLFWSLLYGLFFVTSIYAIVCTSFRTSLLPVPLLTVALIRNSPSSCTAVYANLKRTIAFFLFSFCLYWLFFASTYFPFFQGSISYIGGDTGFYGRAADYLNFKGQENVALDYLHLSSREVEPYHYGDLWIIALLQRTTSINPIVITQIMVYPIFVSISILGLANYCLYLFSGKVNKIYIYMFCVCVGFVSGFSWLFPKSLLNVTVFSIPIAQYPKTLLVTCILIAILWSLKEKNKNAMLLLATLGALLFINTAPAMLLFTGVVCVFCLGMNREMAVSWPCLLLTGASLLFYVLFYRSNNTDPKAEAVISSFHPLTSFNILVGGLLQVFPFIPFLLLLFYSFLKKGTGTASERTTQMWVSFYWGLLFLSGLVSWSVLYSVSFDSVQFFSNLFIPLTSIAVVVILLYTLSSRVNHAVPLFVLFVSVLLNAVPLWGKQYVKSKDLQLCDGFLEGDRSDIFVNIQNLSKAKSFYEKNKVVYQPLEFISYLQPRYINISLNTPDIPVARSSPYATEENNMVQSAPFSLFIKAQGKQVTKEENAYLFVKEYGIQYISVAPDSRLFKSLDHLVEDSIQLSDGWRIYSLAYGRE